jgi:hypothetical protein
MARRPRTRVRSELKNTAYEIFIGILSILSIANLVLMYLFSGDEPLQLILSVMNALFSAIFLGDFIYRISTAPSAAGYFFRGFGWADLLASLPFAQLKILRVFRLLRVARLLREVGPRTIWTTLVHDRANSTLMTLLLLGVLVLQFGSLGILAIEEHAEGANITSASDALWYTIVTISTVGYGDQYPVTNLGRALGSGIIIVGVGIFGTFTGYLANLFLGPQKDAGNEAAPAEAGAAAEAGSAAGAAPADKAGSTPGVGERATHSAGHPEASAGVSGAGGSGAGSPVGDSGPASDASQRSDAAREPLPAEVAAKLEALLLRHEETAAEIRRLLAGSGPAH